MTTYAIIGAGAIGSALAERFTAAQIPAIIANSRGPGGLLHQLLSAVLYGHD